MRVITKWNCAPALLACALLGSGCGAPGPRALLKGEKLVRERRFDAAIEQLQKATRLLQTNAHAWNHLGLAYHSAGQVEQAQRAYRQALNLDFNLAAVRYNLGSLALEQNDTVGALEHLTSYTVFQPESADGWIKLGNAQVRARKLDQAEKSFKSALDLRPRDPEALNGLGNIAYHRRKPQEALLFFTTALGEDPKYAPALFNAAVIHQSQNSPQQALQEFKQYATLAPAAANVDAVYAQIAQLEGESPPPAQPLAVNITTPKTNALLPPPPTRAAPTSAPPTIVAAPPRTSAPPRIITSRQTSAAPAVANRPLPTLNKTGDVQVTRLEEDLVVKPVQDVAPGRTGTVTGATEVSPKPPNDDRSLIARLNPFNGRTKAAPQTNSTPTASAPPQRAAPPPPTYPRYRYASPAAPKPGNRKAAERLFGQGVSAQQSGVLAQAVARYEQAAQTDPAYFEAYYNLGLATYNLGKWQQSLSAYETALALKPESIDTRYNFALALKQAGYPLDAVDELKRILKANPFETRAHLSLGNLYAQQLQQSALARQHYLKVLAAEPNHAKGAEIRYWLAANPQ